DLMATVKHLLEQDRSTMAGGGGFQPAESRGSGDERPGSVPGRVGMGRAGENTDNSGPGGREPADAHGGTIARRREGIARLENELQEREEACREIESAYQQGERSEVADPASGEEAARLRAELSARDETIGLLLDQLRLIEEAEAATRAEWEQLAQWVAAV